MKATLVGIKHISGNSRRTGVPFSLDVACLTSDMPDRDVQNGAKGLDVCTPVIPDRFLGLLTESNIGKDFRIEFYFANGRTNIAYCDLWK